MCMLYCMNIICTYSIVCTLYNLLDPEPGGEKEEFKPVLKNGLEGQKYEFKNMKTFLKFYISRFARCMRYLLENFSCLKFPNLDLDPNGTRLGGLDPDQHYIMYVDPKHCLHQKEHIADIYNVSPGSGKSLKLH